MKRRVDHDRIALSYAAGEKVVNIAAEYGCDPTRVSQIAKERGLTMRGRPRRAALIRPWGLQ